MIGISSMVGAHLSVAKKLRKELEARNSQDIPVILGGVVPEEDYESLHAAGVRKIFPTGTTVKEIAEWVHTTLKKVPPSRRSREA